MVNIMEKTLFKMEVRCFILDTKNQWMESLEAPLQRFDSFFNKADASFGFRTSICSNAQKKGGNREPYQNWVEIASMKQLVN